MEERLRFVLELAPGQEPVAGELVGGGESRAFVGWMELVAALESALDAGAGGPTDGAGARTANKEES